MKNWLRNIFQSFDLKEDDLSNVSPAVFSKIIVSKVNIGRFLIVVSLALSAMIFVFAEYTKELPIDELVIINISLIFFLSTALYGVAIEFKKIKYLTYSELFLYFWETSAKSDDPDVRRRAANIDKILRAKIDKLLAMETTQYTLFILGFIFFVAWTIIT